MTTLFVEIEHGTPRYHAVRELRDAVLRRPLGLALPEDFGPEDGFRHFALIEDETVVACVMAVPRGPGRWQIRQMAVAFDRQRAGLGREVLRRAEAALGASGARYLYLHARAHAIGFYERLGYVGVGERFEEVGIAHLEMEKALLNDEW